MRAFIQAIKNENKKRVKPSNYIQPSWIFKRRSPWRTHVISQMKCWISTEGRSGGYPPSEYGQAEGRVWLSDRMPPRRPRPSIRPFRCQKASQPSRSPRFFIGTPSAREAGWPCTGGLFRSKRYNTKIHRSFSLCTHFRLSEFFISKLLKKHCSLHSWKAIFKWAYAVHGVGLPWE